MMARLRTVGAFWYDFIVGDDWRVALAVVAGLAVTFGLSHVAPAWWVVPAMVLLVLPWSLWRARRRG